jgi:hypothetical protein
MSEIEPIINHPLYSMIASTKESLLNVENDDEFLIHLNEYAIQSLNRVRVVINHLGNQVDSLDPLLFRRSLLDQIYNELSYVNSELGNYRSTFINNLNTLNQRLDNLLSWMSQLVTIINGDSIETIRETVTSFRKSVGRQKSLLDSQQEEIKQKSNSIWNKASDMEGKFQQFEENINSSIQKIEDKYNELQQNFITSQELRSQ